MEERRGLFDASAYMLFEATGDSESHQYFDAAFEEEEESGAYTAAAEEDDDDDDAQSCSYRSSYRSAPRLHEAVDGGDDFRGAEFDYFSVDDEEDYGGGSDEEEGVVDQCRSLRRKAAAEPMKSKGCEMMNEREGDKLFWEACLAS